jgi:hypothetical protein
MEKNEHLARLHRMSLVLSLAQLDFTFIKIVNDICACVNISIFMGGIKTL